METVHLGCLEITDKDKVLTAHEEHKTLMNKASEALHNYNSKYLGGGEASNETN